MKIKEMFIDGFGHFHNYPIRDLSPNLSIIKGPNEAGKSTLLAFIRRMLFGKPLGRSYNPYKPLNGGDHGGRLTVETDAGEMYDIVRRERFDKYSILDSSGLPFKRPIESIIGSADQYFFDNVFAFGLEELYKFETLSDESIQNHVIGAGVGMKTCSIPVLRRDIKGEINSLYYSGARSKPKIMKNVKEISNIERKIRSFSKTQNEYDPQQKLKRDEREELLNIKRQKKDIQRQIDHWDNILGIWDEWTEYQQSSKQLAELQVIEIFPENGIHELDRIKERIQERHENKKGKGRELQNLQIDFEDITLNTSVIESENKIRNLERGLEKYLDYVSSRDTLSEEISQTEDQYRRNLSAIDPEWDDNILLSFDLSSEVQSLVVDFKQKFTQYEEEKRDLSKEIKQLEGERDTLTPQLQFVKGTLKKIGDLPSEESISREKKAIDELYTEIPSLDRKQAELEVIEKEEAAGNELWKEKKAFFSSKMPVWPAGLIIVAGILSLGFGILNDSLFIGMGFFIAFVIVAGIYYFTAKKQENQQIGASEDDTTAVTENTVLEWADIRQKKQNEIQNLEFRLVEVAGDCGFETVPNVSILSNKRNDLEHLSKAIIEKENQESQKIKLEQEINLKNGEFSEKREQLTKIEEKISQLKSEWINWLEKASLPDTMLPEIVLGLFAKIEQLSTEYYVLQKNTQRLQVLNASIEEYEGRLDSLFRQCQFQSCGSIDGDVEIAVSSLKQNSEYQNKLNSMTRLYKKLEAEIKSLTDEIESFESKKTELLAKGSSEDEDQFREYDKIWKEREQLKASIETSRKNIIKAAGKAREFDHFVETFESVDHSEIKGTKTDLESKLAQIEEQIEEKNKKIGQISEVLTQLEAEDESADLESQRLLFLEDLHENSREWAKRVIATHLLNKAVERYEKERQPAVILEATNIFADISNGRYQRIIKPLESDAVIVEEVTGGRKTINQLSRGTAEQLYLALRFGYITEFGKHDVGLPVVFDDVLVNFDPVRKENSCRAIAQLAETSQIIYFTCHPETVELLKISRPDAVVIDLERNMG